MFVGENPQFIINVLPEPKPTGTPQPPLAERVVRLVESAFKPFSNKKTSITVEVSKTPPPKRLPRPVYSPYSHADQIFIEGGGPFECSIQ